MEKFKIESVKNLLNGDVLSLGDSVISKEDSSQTIYKIHGFIIIKDMMYIQKENGEASMLFHHAIKLKNK